MADVTLKIKSDFDMAQRDIERLGTVSEATQKKVAAFSKAFKTEQIDKFIERNKRSAIAVTATKGKFAGLQNEARGLQKEITRLIRNGLEPNDARLHKLKDSYSRVNKALDETRKNTKKTGVSFAKLTSAIVGANLIERGLFAIKDGFVGIFNAARRLEDAEASFTPLIGGAEKAKELVKQLNIAAAQTPFQFDAIRKATTSLLPIMNGDIQKTVDTFKMLGDTAGGNAQRLDTVTRGFSKAMLKGKVDMESLNMIAESGVPIFKEMAATMGLNKDQMEDFFKRISTGKVSTDVLIKTFKNMTSEGGIFYQGMIIASKTTSGVLSTLSDNITMVAAGIGQAFLPQIKEVALGLTKIAGGVLEWVSTGDNLQDTLAVIGYGLTALVGGFAAYTIATNIATISTAGFITGIKALTIALASNPLTVLAVVVTAVLVPAIIYLAKNWDLVKFKFQDFILTTKIGFIAFGNMIREKVIGGVIKLMKLLSDLPGVGDMFKPMIEAQENIIDLNKKEMQQLLNLRQTKRTAFEATQKELLDEAENLKKNAGALDKANDGIKQSYAERLAAFNKMLTTINISEQAGQNQRIEASQKFFADRAQIESMDASTRIEFLKAQYDTIKQLAFDNAADRLAAETGLTQAIAAEQTKRFNSYARYGQQIFSSTSNLFSSLSTIMKNAGKESRELAVVQKAIAMAQAAINTALAVSLALATIPPPANFIMAGITLAAGVAEQVAIATTPIPSAQTGIDFTVPETKRNRNDGAAVMASAGEQVQVTPRGEDNMKTTNVNINISEFNIFRVVQRGIDNGNINLTPRNLGRTVFNS